MFTEELEVLEIENDAIKNFDCELPFESKSATKKAKKFAENFLLDNIDVDNIIVVGAEKETQENKIDFSNFGVGLTKGLDFSNLAKENPDWENEIIVLATEEDLLFSKFFLDGEQNDATRNYRKGKKQLDEFDDEDDED